MNDLTNIAHQINREHDTARKCIEGAVAHAIEAGRLLVEAKAGMSHGGWLPWLAANVQFSVRTAQVYQRMYERRDELNAQRAAHLPMRQAMRLLADPKPASVSAPADTDYLPIEGHYLFVSVRGGFVLVAPSDHAGYFYVTRMVPDCQGIVGFEGLRRGILATHAARIAREWTQEAGGSEWTDNSNDGSSPDGFGPLPWTYNRLLFDSKENWIKQGILRQALQND